MKRSLYRDRDYAFGQTILTLRTMLGLTQAGLAEHLGVSRKAVVEWEGGLNYPKAEHLKAFIALAVEKQAFPAGREAEEVRIFWQAARQKVLLDEAWLGTLLPDAEAPPASQLVEEAFGAVHAHAPTAGTGRHRQVGTGDAGDAPGGRALRGGHLAFPARCSQLRSAAG